MFTLVYIPRVGRIDQSSMNWIQYFSAAAVVRNPNLDRSRALIAQIEQRRWYAQVGMTNRWFVRMGHLDSSSIIENDEKRRISFR